MSPTYALPDVNAVTQMLSMVFGTATVKPTPPLAAKTGTLIAVYVSDDNIPVAASLCDPAFAAYAGSALSLVSANDAKKAASSGKLSDTMQQNLYEVMNICSSLLMSDRTPHLKLDNLYRGPEQLPENARAMLGAVAGRIGFEVTISRYGSGHLSFLTT